jgi:hypothetical protein
MGLASRFKLGWQEGQGDMQSNRSNLAVILAAAIAALGLAAPAAFADSADLDTGVASWSVQRNLIGGEADPNTNNLPSDTYPAVPVLDPFYEPNFFENAWVVPSSLGDGSAEWVSWTSYSGTTYDGDAEDGEIVDDGTSYVYTETFTLTAAEDALFKIKGSLAADNVISGISLEDDTEEENVPVTFVDNSLDDSNYYHVASTFSASEPDLFDDSSEQEFTLTVDVINWDGSPYGDPEGTGFILDGWAHAYPDVPEPSSILLCVGAATGALLRRKR